MAKKKKKNRAKAKQNPEPELLLFEHYLFSSSTLSSKNNRAYSKKCAKKQVCLFVYFNQIIMINYNESEKEKQIA